MPSQANAIALIADKLDPAVDGHPWISSGHGGVSAKADWFSRTAAGGSTSHPDLDHA